MNMSIRGSAPTLASTRTSPVLRDKFVPNAKVAVDVDSAKFFNLLIGRLSSAPRRGRCRHPPGRTKSGNWFDKPFNSEVKNEIRPNLGCRSRY